MKYVVNQRMQDIFAHAAALQQNGRLRSIIYGYEEFVYILNQDRTLLLQFPLTRTNDPAFSEPISFHANDYKSSTFYFKDGYINFVSTKDGYRKVSKCRAPEHSPKEIHNYFCSKLKEIPQENGFIVRDSMLPLMQNELTHLEVQAKGGKIRFLQRNIYEGSKEIITPVGGLLDISTLKDFGPVGLRTNDFLSLFTFANKITFYFSSKDAILLENKDRGKEYTGLLSLCRYNELKG